MIGTLAPSLSAQAHSNAEEIILIDQDFADRWHLLYFYPLDFTSICPTEIRGFEALKADFEAECLAKRCAGLENRRTMRGRPEDEGSLCSLS